MTPEYDSVYKYWPTDSELVPMIVTGFRARRLEGETPEQHKLGERYEFLYNTAGEWPQRAFYGVLLSDKNNRFVFRDLERSGVKHTFEYLSPALFKLMSAQVQGGAEIVKWPEDELQNYYHQSLIFPQWVELGRLSESMTETAAAKVGDVHSWKDGYDHQKQKDGSWKKVKRTDPTKTDKWGPQRGAPKSDVSKDEREAILASAYSHNPTRRVEGFELGHIAPESGEWRDEAMGVPKNTNEKYLVDKETNKYTEDRERLHRLIENDTLSRVSAPPRGEHPVAVLTMGLPASGKSSSIDEVTKGQAKNMANIDADLVKEALPEYREAVKQRARNAASLAHKESAQVAEDIREEATNQGKSFVFHGVRGDPDYYREFMGRLNQAGYEVNVVFMWMPEKNEAKRRADRRAEITGRRVPHTVIDMADEEVTPNFKAIEDLGANVHVYDARGERPKLAWKREGDQIEAPSREFSNELEKAAVKRTESKDSGSGKPSKGRKTRPEHTSQDVVDLVLAGHEHDERTLQALEKTGYKFGSDEGIISGLGDERPEEDYPLQGKKKNRSR